MSNSITTIGIAFLVVLSTFTRADFDPKTDSLIRVIENQPDDTTKVRNLFVLSKALLTKDVQLALKYNQRLFELSSKLDYLPGIVDFYHLKSAEKYYAGDLDSARHFLNIAFPLAESGYDIDKLATLYRLYGIIEKGVGNFLLAEKYFSKSLDMFYITGNITRVCDVYNSLGLMYDRQNLHDSASHYFFKSISLADSVGLERQSAVAKINFAKTLIEIGEYQKAIEYCMETNKVFKKINHIRFEGLSYVNIGMAHQKLQNYDSALFYYNQAGEVYKQLNSPSALINVLLNMGAVYSELKQHHKMLEYTEQALRIARSSNKKETIVSALINIGLGYERIANYPKAEKYYDSALRIAREYDYLNDIHLIYYNYFKLYELQRDYKKAFEYQQKYLTMYDSVYNAERDAALQEIEKKYQLQKKEAQLLDAKNEVLEAELTVKKRTNERNLISVIGAAVLIVLLLIFILYWLRSNKNKIIREKEIARLEQEKQILAAKAIVEGQEDERKRVAQELHDGLGLLLTTAKVQFTNYIDENPENKDMLDKARLALDKASTDIRRISHNIMPGVLIKYGIYEAVEDLFDEVNEAGNIVAVIEVRGQQVEFSENTSIMLYRVIQEMLNNTLKHASATDISLILEEMNGNFRIHYSDNGIGFEKDEVLKEKSMGLNTIRSRVEYLQGEYEIDTAPGKGTAFFIEIPLESKLT